MAQFAQIPLLNDRQLVARWRQEMPPTYVSDAQDLPIDPLERGTVPGGGDGRALQGIHGAVGGGDGAGDADFVRHGAGVMRWTGRRALR